MTIEVVNAAGCPIHAEAPEPVRFASMSRDTARQLRVRTAIAVERTVSPRAKLSSRVLYVIAALILIAAAAVFTAGPSDMQTEQATADNVRDAIAAAVATAQTRSK